MKKTLIFLIIFVSFGFVFSEDEILPLPAWNTSTKRVIDRRMQLRNLLTAPPSGVIYSPAEYAQMEGVIIQVPTTMTNLRKYYAEMIIGIIDAGAIPYIIADSNNTSFWQARDDIKHITDNVLKPNGINPMDVVFLDVKYNANWTRDYGPYHIYLNGKRAIINNEYYDDRPQDNAFNYRLSELWEEEIFSTGLSTEGGNFMTDGLGTCWTSTGTLYDNITYNKWTEQEISAIYRDYLNCYNGIYYPEPLPNENTTHIDMFSKILDQHTIIVGYSNTSLGAEQKEIDALDAAAEFYRNTPKPDGGQWNIVRIPMTFGTINYGWGKSRVQYTHTNSTIVNDHVLVPTYNKGTDLEALEIYQELMPDHIIVPIDSNAIITSGGAIHCTTMQVPVKNYVRCGNGVIEDDEECDTYFLNGASCSSIGDYTGGKLKCGKDCRYDTSECYPQNGGSDNDIEKPDENTSDNDTAINDDDISLNDEDSFTDNEEQDDESSKWEDDNISDKPANSLKRKSDGCSITLL